MVLYYVPCPDNECAEKISRTLLTEKLIGCANILPGMTSMYWWEGKIETSAEVILILKTLASSPTLESRIKELHPYEVPCIMTLPVSGVNEPYKAWLEKSLK